MKPFLGSLVLGFMLGNPLPVLAAESEVPTEESVRRLLDVTGAEALGLQMMDSMIRDLRGSFPAVPSSFWEKFRAEVEPGEITRLIIPVYQKHLSQEDVDDVTAFFSSAAGQRFVKKQPAIMTDSMQVGAEWGEKLADKVLERLEAEGHIK